MINKSLWAIASALILLTGCANTEENTDDPIPPAVIQAAIKEKRKNADSWYHPSPNGSISAFRENLDQSKFKEVPDKNFSTAEHLLNSKPLVLVTEEEANKFLGTPIKRGPGEMLYLARALYLDKDTGSFTISYKDGKLWIIHACLGHVSTMHRRALVVSIQFQPSEVFVDCTAAE